MVEVRINTKTVRSNRIWNDILAEHYDFEDRPEWREETDETRVARMRKTPAKALVEEHDHFEFVDDNQSDDSIDSGNGSQGRGKGKGRSTDEQPDADAEIELPPEDAEAEDASDDEEAAAADDETEA